MLFLLKSLTETRKWTDKMLVFPDLFSITRHEGVKRLNRKRKVSSF